MENVDFLKLQEKAQFGNAEAIIHLADYYLELNNPKLAFQTLERLSTNGDKDIYSRLAHFYEKGIGCDIDISKAKKYYRLSFDMGDEKSGYQLARISIKEGSYEDIGIYLSLGVYNNYLPAIKMLSYLYLNGIGLLKNENVAINLLNKASELGDISSYDEIGKIYYSKKDYLNAVHYFELGTNYFEPNAIYHLAICYSKGEGAHLDLQKAINLYEIGISKGHARCAYNLAFLYKNGLGVKIDDEKYENLMRKYQELLHNTKI